jgi:hypothetical protein
LPKFAVETTSLPVEIKVCRWESKFAVEIKSLPVKNKVCQWGLHTKVLSFIATNMPNGNWRSPKYQSFAINAESLENMHWGETYITDFCNTYNKKVT